MNQNNTSRTILSFIILSVIVHGLIAYMITQTNPNKRNIQIVELADQTKLNNKSNNQIKKQASPTKPKRQKRLADKKPRRKKTPRITSQKLANKSTPVKPVSQKKTNQKPKEKILPTLPDHPLAETKNSHKITASDKSSKIDLGSIKQSDESDPDKSMPVAIQELPLVTKSQEQNSSDDLQQEEVSISQKKLSETPITNLSEADLSESDLLEAESSKSRLSDMDSFESENKESQLESVSGRSGNNLQHEGGLLDSDSVPPAKSLGEASQALSKGQHPTYQINQIHVIRPTSFKYPQISRHLKEEGSATLRMFFNEEGYPQKIDLVKSTGSAHLDKAAMNGASTLRFKPLGHAFIYELPVRFRLDLSDQQLNQRFDQSTSPKISGNGVGKFKTKAQSLSP